MQVVESDLRLISLESRKKWPRVKEAAERGILWAHSYRGVEKGRDLTPLLSPLILCLETNDEKLVVYGLSALQKLLSHSFVPSEEVGKFLAKLEELARDGFDQAHLKVLQTIVTLLSTMKLSEMDLNKALTICFILHAKGAQAVGNIASASLRQCLTMLLDSGEYGVSGAILQDLCALALGEAVLWLVAVPPLEQAFCLEMIETVLAHPAASSNKVMMERVKTCVCPMVHRVLQVMDQHQDGKNIRLTLRVLRILRTLLSSMAHVLVAETEVLVTKVGRWMAEGQEITWHHVALLEVIQGCCGTPQWLQRVFETYDVAQLNAKQVDATPVFALLMRSVGRVAQLTWRWSSGDMDDLQGPATGALLDHLQPSLPTWVLQRSRMARQLTDCFEAVAASVRASRPEVRGLMVAAVWPPLSGAVACILGKASGLQLSDACLRCLIDMVAATHQQVGGDVIRDAVMQVIIKTCEDNEGNPKRQAHVRPSVEALENAIRAAHAQLSPAAWYGALNIMMRVSDSNGEVLTEEMADEMLSSTGSSVPVDVAGGGGGTLPTSVWSATCSLGDADLEAVVGALSKLCNASLQLSGVSVERRCWAANKLCLVLLLNGSRAAASSPHRGTVVSALWRDATTLLLSVCNHQQTAIRAQGLQSVYSLCTRGVAFECAVVASLEMLRAMGLSLYADVRMTAVKGMEYCVRVKGHLLGVRGWGPVLHAISESSKHGKKEEVTRGFAVLQLVVEELLQEVGTEENLLVLVHAIGCYSLQDSDSNASLTTPALVWSLAHHIMTHLKQEAYVPLWEPLLKLLTASARDATREEVRAGGLRTLFKMVELYHGQWPASLWESCCSNVLVPLLIHLTNVNGGGAAAAATKQAHHQLTESWLSTLSLAATGFASLPPGPGLRLALRSLLQTALLAHVSFSPMPQKPRACIGQILMAYASLLEHSAGGNDESSSAACWRALQDPFRELVKRACVEATELEKQAGSTSTMRFSHYFVLVDAVRMLLVPAAHYHGADDVGISSRLIVGLVRAQPLYSDALYRQAGILYDPQYKPHTVPPLLPYTMSSLKAQVVCHAADPATWAAFALAASHAVNGLTESLKEMELAALLTAGDANAFPSFPPDPDPCVLQGDLRRSSLLAMTELSGLQEVAPPLAAMPLFAHVLGCILQVRDEELAHTGCDVYVKLCQTALPFAPRVTTVSPLLACLIDVAEHILLTSQDATLCGKCASLLSGPLSSSRATEALLSVCRSPGPNAGVALTQLLQLVPHSPIAAEQALVHCSTVLSGGNPPAQVLHALRQLRLPRSAWSSAPSKLPPDDGRGLTHLLLLYHPLVDAASCLTASDESRKLAAQCLHDLASSLGVPK